MSDQLTELLVWQQQREIARRARDHRPDEHTTTRRGTARSARLARRTKGAT